MPIYLVSFKYTDEQQRSVNRQMLFDEADEADLLATLTGVQADLVGLSKCAVPEYTYSRTVSPGGTPGVGSNVDAGCTFTWASGLAIDPVSKIPDPEEAAKDGQGGIDLSAAIVIAYTDIFLSGTGRLNRNSPTSPTAVKSARLDK